MIDPETAPPLPAPLLSLLLREARAPVEAARFLLMSRRQRDLPRGDGHAVMLVPGFGADDVAMRPLASALQHLGYAAATWGQGRNLGMRPEIRAKLTREIERLHARHAMKVSLIGWSLGGVFVREMARAQPQFVRTVITLGSPINRNPAANNMMPLFKLANRGRPVKLDREGFARRTQPPPVPCVAIHTKSDGIVAWQCACEDPAANTENVEVQGSHFGLAMNLQVLRVIAERLSRPEN
jgi:pimeloyl-ACP methyl ester carboxylesterase